MFYQLLSILTITYLLIGCQPVQLNEDLQNGKPTPSEKSTKNSNPTTPSASLTDNSTNNYSQFFITPQGWKNQLPIPYKIASDFPVELRTSIFSAIKTWEKAAGFKLFSYLGEDSQTSDHYKGLYSVLEDTFVGFYYDQNWNEATQYKTNSESEFKYKSENTIATCVWQTSDDGQAMSRADIRLNANYFTFSDLADSSYTGANDTADTETILVHELGHLLGLDHIPFTDSVMYHEMDISYGIIHRELSKLDIALIQFLYSKPQKKPKLL